MIIRALSEPNKKSIWLALSWTALVLILSFKAPSVNAKYIFPYQDKVVHFVFYFVFVFLWFRTVVFLGYALSKNLVKLVFFAIFLSAIIECCQEFFTTNRHAEWLDLIANSSGAILGGFCVNYFFKNKMT